MKKLFHKLGMIAIVAIYSFNANASLLNDSTVTVINLLEPGDSLKYEYTIADYEIVEGDTIYTKLVSELFQLKWVETLENSDMVLEYKSLGDSVYVGPVDAMAKMPSLKKVERIPIKILTSEFGQFKDIYNFEEYMNEVNSVFDENEYKSYMKESLKGKNSNLSDEELNIIVQNTKSMMFGKGSIQTALYPVLCLLSYNGYEFKLNSPVEEKAPIQLPMIGEEIDAVQTFEAIPLKDTHPEMEGWVILRDEKVYDTDEFLLKATAWAASIAGKDIPNDFFSNVSPEVKQYVSAYNTTSLYIYPDQGYVSYVFAKTFISDGRKVRVNDRNVEIVYE